MSAIRIPGMLVTFLEERSSVACAATRDAGRRPRTHWVCGWRVRGDGRAIICSVPAPFAPALLADLADNGRFALTVEHIGPHETYQFKGRASAVGPCDAADAAAAARCRERFTADVEKLHGHSYGGLLAQYCMEPSQVVTLEVEEVYVQTPGPRAGRRLAPPEATA